MEAAGEKQAEAAARIDPPDRSGRRGGREKGLSTGDVKHEWRRGGKSGCERGRLEGKTTPQMASRGRSAGLVGGFFLI